MLRPQGLLTAGLCWWLQAEQSEPKGSHRVMIFLPGLQLRTCCDKQRGEMEALLGSMGFTHALSTCEN